MRDDIDVDRSLYFLVLVLLTVAVFGLGLFLGSIIPW